jgi:hypothetical protein
MTSTSIKVLHLFDYSTFFVVTSADLIFDAMRKTEKLLTNPIVLEDLAIISWGERFCCHPPQGQFPIR